MTQYSQRAKQLFWALSAGFRTIDMDTIRAELSEDEQGLFFSMSKVDQYHAYRVYETVLELWKQIQSESNAQIPVIDHEIASKYFILLKKAALLHDIGRRAGEFSIADKVMAVVFDSIYNKAFSDTKEIKMEQIKKTKKPSFLYLYYYHPEVSEKLLKLIQADPLLIYLVKNHHNLEGELPSITELETYHMKMEESNEIVAILLQILQKADALN